jgi:hypothetical protein
MGIHRTNGSIAVNEIRGSNCPPFANTWIHPCFWWGPCCRLSITGDSFIPSTIRQWNSLTPSLRNVEYIAKFKTELRKQKYIR